MQVNEEFIEQQFPDQKSALLVILVTFLLILFVGLIGAFYLGKTELLLSEIVIIIPAWVYVSRKKYPFRRVFRLRGINFRIAMASFLIGLAIVALSDELDRLIQLFFPMPEGMWKMVREALIARTTSDFLIIFFSAVLVAGVCEEMLFRGFLQNSLERVHDVTKAVLLSALIFAVIHFNPWWIIQIIVLGVILGVMAWKSDSIIPGAIVHGVNNGLAIYFTNLEESKYQWYLWNDHVAPAILILAGLFAFWGFKLFYRYCEEEQVLNLSIER